MGHYDSCRERDSKTDVKDIAETTDMVNSPAHYTQGRYEVIAVIEDWKLEHHESTALKYIARAKHKINRIEDLEKAVWYLNRKIKLLKELKDVKSDSVPGATRFR